MLDKFLKIGLSLGIFSATGSIVYWSTQYEKHMPFYKPPSINKISSSKRLSNQDYLKIKEIENQVGCKFFVILNNEKNAYGLLKEDQVTDEILKNLSFQFDEDKKTESNKTDILTVQNLKRQCQQLTFGRKTLRIILEKKNEGQIGFEFKSRTNDQGPGYTQIE